MNAEAGTPRKSQWALADILQDWKGRVGPLARKAYLGINENDTPTDPDLCDQLAELLEGKARTAREAARLAREEMSA